MRGFVNVASFGLSGAVDAVVKDAPPWLGGKAAFFAATLRAMATYTNPSVRVRVDGALWLEGPTMTVALGNGRFFGGGMMITPHADPSDGKLSVVSLGDLSRLQAMGLTSKIYQGTHVAVHGVTVTTGTTIEAEPMHAWATVLLDVDGEQPGKLPDDREGLPWSATFPRLTRGTCRPASCNWGTVGFLAWGHRRPIGCPAFLAAM